MTDSSLYSTIIKKKNSDIFCNNCGKTGHQFKSCIDSITSIGLINIHIDDHYNIPRELIEDIYDSIVDDENNTNRTGIRYNDKFDASIFNAFKDSICFTMVRRKYTLGYIEFIRGRYKINNIDGLIYLFEQMTKDEIDMIGDANDFDDLWNDLWIEKDVSASFVNEHKISKEKFNKLKYINHTSEYFNLAFYLDNVTPSWEFPEWGFPKGRRNGIETNLDCGIREFIEETGVKPSDFVVAKKLQPIEEEFIGTNGIKYKHIYFLSVSKNKIDLLVDKENKHQFSEIGDIGSFDYTVANGIIRPYHTSKKAVLSQCYTYVINKLIEAINNPSKTKFEE